MLIVYIPLWHVKEVQNIHALLLAHPHWCHFVDFRHCTWAQTSNYGAATMYKKQSHTVGHTLALHLTHTQNTATRSFSMLEAQGCDLSKGFLLQPVCQTVWRAVEGLASPRLALKKPSPFAFCGTASSFPSSPVSISPTSSLLTPLEVDYRAETGRLIPTQLLYLPDKALWILFGFQTSLSHLNCH